MRPARFGKVFGIKAMDQLDSYDWMSSADRLTAAQARKQREQQHLGKVVVRRITV